MFEEFNHTIGIKASCLFSDLRLLSYDSYKRLCNSGDIIRLRRGCYKTPALIDYEELSEEWKEEIISQYGNPHETHLKNKFEQLINRDIQAAEFYSQYKLPDGRFLEIDIQLEYRTNAEILNACITYAAEGNNKRKVLSGSTKNIWSTISDLVNALSTKKYKHTLPTNARSFQRKYKLYQKDSFLSLIHKNYCNDNSRKITAKLEDLILSLYTLPNKPYTSSVHDLYHQFIGNAIDVVDVTTGELFERSDFFTESGQPITFSEATTWNYINDPKNRPIVDKFRSGRLEFNNIHRPHHHRHSPFFSYSKISMDDRDLPRKMPNGKRVKAYYAYDVASGCVVGVSYSHDKNAELFIDCVRDMFRRLDNQSMGIPMEVEVEHHLVALFKDDLMKAGTIFPFVRWAGAGNAQEKRAEHFHRRKKYGYEKKYQNGIGRFYSKLEANRTASDKISDGANNNWKEEKYSYETIVADDLKIIEK